MTDARPVKVDVDAPLAEKDPGAHVDKPPILSVESLEVAYGQTQVLFGVSLEVPDGGLCCLMGRNGVGKSTLLQTIVGLQPAKAGTIKLSWSDITKRAPYDRTKSGIAYVPQGREAFPYLSVYENLRVVAEASDRSGAAVIEEALERFPRLRKILDRPAGFLSGGEAQQLAIARALVTRPRLLLLDEPTEGIQPSIILEIEDAIADLKAGGMSILLVEQYVDFAMRLADTYAVMDVGRIVASGPTATFERARMQQLMSV
jgi:urea transport system ATP-binding protein